MHNQLVNTNSSSYSSAIVVKCGGSIINNQAELASLIQDVATLKSQGFTIVIVHGGGPDITDLCQALAISSNFVNGLRITNDDVLAVTQMALLGKTNNNLVYKFNLANIPAIGLSGHDATLLRADFVNQSQLGYVGKVTQVNGALVQNLLALGLTPVIAPLGVDHLGNTFNINADFVAAEVAVALGAEKLVLLSDIDGYYQNFHDKTSVIPLLKDSQIEHLIATQQISGGMVPKLMSCLTAVQAGVKSAHIVNGNRPQSLINAVTSEHPHGTTVIQGQSDDN
ncbi:MAG: acetylglutamate kinase [Burkholderiales bacterium]